jgi:ELWxxDGT repeat protein
VARVFLLAVAIALLFAWTGDASAKKRVTLDHLAVTLTTPVTAGANFTLTAKALDATNHTITSYNGPATWSDLSGSLSGAATTFVNGLAKSTVAQVANPYHDDRITVSSGGKTAKSSLFNVFAVLDHLTLTVTPPVRTGTNFTITAKAYDSGNNLITTYNSPVTFSDLSGSLSGTPTNFTNGTAKTTVAQIANAWRSDKITVDSGGKTKQSAVFNVIGPLDHLTVAVSVAGVVTIGGNFNITAKAYDSANNPLTSYSGAIAFTDLSGTLTGTPTTMTNGVATTTTAQVANPFHKDRVSAQSGAANGQSTAFDVLGPLDHFEVGHPSSGFFATSTFTIIATARDVAGNFLASYNGPATWFDLSGTLDPLAPQPFVNGTSTTNNVGIGSAYSNDTITVQSGGQQGTSDPFESTGAKLLKDINPGFNDSNFDLGPPLTIGGTMYFAADDGVHGVELWKSNGTTAGTVLVKDINPGAGDSNPGWFADLNGTLYFAADDGSDGYELWKSNGTSAGTTMVADINPGLADGDPEELVVMGGVLYFSATDGVNGNELWSSDGTTTAMVDDINPTGNSFPAFLTPVNGTLFFEADDGTDGNELWSYDGTTAQLVKDIDPGSASSTISELTNDNGTLFFQADDGTNGFELWKSNGTDAGTTMVKDINPGSADSAPIDLTVLNGLLLFQADDGTNGFQLWSSDGTDLNTQLVKIINPYYDAFGGTAEFTVYNGNVYFKADDGVHGVELWRTNGTTVGTALVKDINPADDGFPSFFSVVGGKLYFAADNFFDGFELWRTDGSVPGTYEVKDIDTCGCGSLPHYLTDLGGKLFFFADDGIHGFELWRG